jgi:hypothetical protein
MSVPRVKTVRRYDPMEAATGGEVSTPPKGPQLEDH